MTTVVTYTDAGSGTWTCPAGVTTVLAECWGGGGGGAGQSGPAGGGGEYAREPALAVTAGTSYSFTVGAAGTGGPEGQVGDANSGGSGGNSTFAGDSVTVTANGGQGGQYESDTAAGGTGSANTVHYNGGAGGADNGGGGSSGGTGSAGNPGDIGTDDEGGTGSPGAAVTGGGPGGHGDIDDGRGAFSPVSGPGGGGGGGSWGDNRDPGAAGWAGQVQVTFSLVAATPGSWYQLDDTLKEQVAYKNYYASQPPVACPHCGEPLTNGPPQAEAQLYCRFDGWQYPRDYDENSMSGM